MTDLDNMIDMLDEDDSVQSDEPAEKVEPKAPPQKKGRGKKKSDASDAPTEKDPLSAWFKTWGWLGEESQPESFEQLLVTHLLPLDRAMGVGGIPYGQIMTIFGPEGVGKTALCQMIAGCSQEQHPDKLIIWVSGEGKWNPDMATRNGLDVSQETITARKFLLWEPDKVNGMSWESMILAIEQLITPNPKFGNKLPAPNGVVVIVDSQDSISTKAELEMEIDDGGVKYGGMAKSNSVTLKRLANRIRHTNSLMIIIQQARDDIDALYGKQIKTSGGRAILNYSRTRFKIQRREAIKSGDEIIGHNTEFSVVKNDYWRHFVKFGAELRYDYDSVFGGGFDRYAGLIDVGKLTGNVRVHDAWHEFPGFQHPSKPEELAVYGRDKARRFLIDNPAIAMTLEDQIRASIFGE